MNNTTLQFLQEEKARLRAKNETCQKEILILEHHLEVLAELYWTAQGIATEPDLFNLLDALLYTVITAIGTSDGSLSRLDPETDELVFTIVHGSVRKQLPGYRIKSDTGIAGWILQEAKPVIVNNTRQDWRFSQQVDEEFTFFTRSVLGVPIAKQNEPPMGVIQLVNKREDFIDSDVILLSVLGNVAALILEEMERRA